MASQFAADASVLPPRCAAGVVITVDYKGRSSTATLIDSLSQLDGFCDIDVLIADNSPQTEPAIIENLKHRNVEIVACATNRGYFGAARFALDRYLESGKELPPWVIVCNNDILVEDRGLLLKLHGYDYRHIAVIAPCIHVGPQKRDQNPYFLMRPSWCEWTKLRVIYSQFVLALMWDWLSRVKNRHFVTRAENKRQAIYAAHGAFMIFSREYFERGGYLDDNLFLYGEELAVAEICRRINLSVVYDPALRVLHDEHTTVGKKLTRFSFECQRNALAYIQSTYRT